ncbi:MAG TPA: sugar phosphate isomerase/epimerase, partial [Anaerolineales bacterium]|nr:sugar phosphate isomerase/epimerase [Anaerolineales bacterium]
RKLLDASGLRAVSCHFVPTPDMSLAAIVDDLNAAGADSLGCAIAFWQNQDEVKAFCEAFNQYAEVTKQGGVQLYYHNHFEEFQVFGDKSAYDLLTERLDPALVKFEFDTFWAVRGGQDPVYWLKKLGKRCDLIHQKDMPAAASPVNLFEKYGYDTPITIDVLWPLQSPDQFGEIGTGVLPIASYLKAARTYNDARYVFVEQDVTALPEIESVAVSYVNLTKLLAEN